MFEGFENWFYIKTKQIPIYVWNLHYPTLPYQVFPGILNDFNWTIFIARQLIWPTFFDKLSDTPTQNFFHFYRPTKWYYGIWQKNWLLCIFCIKIIAIHYIYIFNILNVNSIRLRDVLLNWSELFCSIKSSISELLMQQIQPCNFFRPCQEFISLIHEWTMRISERRKNM